MPYIRNSDRSYEGPKGSIPPEYGDELEDKLAETLDLINQGKTVLLLFEDMAEINEHFQAVLDWLKARGNRMKRRFQQGAFMQEIEIRPGYTVRGCVYFAGADTHMDHDGDPIPTRGVAKEIDMRPEAEELIRSVGLEARLRKAGNI